MNTDYVNTNALLPRTAFLLAVLTVVLALAAILFLVSVPSLVTALTSACFGLLLCNVPRAPAKVTVSLVRILLGLTRCVRSAWSAFVGDPYRPLAYALVLAVAAFLLAVYGTTAILPASAATARGQCLTSENTLVISLLGTFIPFVFAAATFAQNRVAQRVPELIARQALGWANAAVWWFLVVVFLVALAMPLLGIKGNCAAVLQVTLLAVTFLTVVAFVACVLRIADPRNLVPCFRDASERRLRRLFSRYMPLPHIPGARLRSFLQTHVTGIYGRSMELMFGPMTVAKECTDEAIRVAEALLEMVKRGVRNDSVAEATFALDELGAYASCYFWLRQRHLDTSDAFNQYLAAETGKLVEFCATEEKEKFLDAMCQTVRTVGLSACQYTGIGAGAEGNGLLFPWEEMIEKTVVAASSLENTAYSNEGIGVLGDLGAESLRRGHVNTVEFGLFRRLRRMGQAFAGSKFQWHSVMVNRALGALNQAFLTYAQELPRQGFCQSHFLRSSWPETVREILKAKLDNYTPGSLWQPLAPVTCPMCQPHQLLTCYRDALQHVGPLGAETAQRSLRAWGRPYTPEHSRSMLAHMREQLVAAHRPFAVLLESTAFVADNTVWFDLTSSLACLFWLDLCAASDGVGVTEEWVKAVVQQYRKIFSRMAATIQRAREGADGKRYWLDDFAVLAGVVALGLTFRSEANGALVDGIVQGYCDMLLSLLKGYETEPGGERPTRRIRRHMLLVSAWLTSVGNPLPVCEKLQEALTAVPIVVRKSWLTAHTKLSGYPSGPMHQGEWYLFPSCFWPNRVQNQVKARLMEPEFLERYADGYVDLVEEEEEWPPPPGRPADPLRPSTEEATDGPC